jgi:hypothetical protein
MPGKKRRGHIRVLPSGTHQAIAYAGTYPLTREPRYLRGTAPTWDEAEVVLTDLLSQIDEERHPKTNITFGQALDQWLDVATGDWPLRKVSAAPASTRCGATPAGSDISGAPVSKGIRASDKQAAWA